MARSVKLFAGAKVRALREHAGLNQAVFAKQLGISAAYLNQMESNQRPVTAGILIELNRQFGADIAAFSGHEEGRLIADLAEMLRDPVFAGDPRSAAEIRTAVTAAPWLVRKSLELHRIYRTHVDRVLSFEDTLDHGISGAMGLVLPYEEVRDFFMYSNGYLSDLDDTAERLATQLDALEGRPLSGLIQYLKKEHKLDVVRQKEGDSNSDGFLSRSRGAIYLRQDVEEASAAFMLATQVAVIEHSDLLERIVTDAKFQTLDAEQLCRMALANYFAGALLLPYSTFQPFARTVRHDIETLSFRFGANIEQVMHRLSTLQRPGDRGVAMYFAKLDAAGNVIKRHSANRFRFGRFSGTCPLWNVHDALRTPERFHVQVAEMPDRVRYLCVSRAICRSSNQYSVRPRIHVLSIGCELEDAREFVYSDSIDLKTVTPVPIGISCRICQRSRCDHRAMPPLDRGVMVDLDRRGVMPYRLQEANNK